MSEPSSVIVKSRSANVTTGLTGKRETGIDFYFYSPILSLYFPTARSVSYMYIIIVGFVEDPLSRPLSTLRQRLG